MIQRFYTTEEQSKALVECGLDPNTADMYYNPDHFNYPVPEIRGNDGGNDGGNDVYPIEGNYTPCWTASRLFELMPDMLNDDPMLSIRSTKYDNRFKVAYGHSHHDMINVESTNQADLYYNMMIWLLEHDYIKK